MSRHKEIKEIKNIANKYECISKTNNNICCLEYDINEIKGNFSSPIFLNSLSAILVLNGTARININYKYSDIEKDTIVILSASHLFYFESCDKDFSCMVLSVNKDFMYETDSTDMIYMRIKYGTKLHNAPILKLSSISSTKLKERMEKIHDTIEDTEHLYYKEMILNSLFAFYLDLNNVIDRLPMFSERDGFIRYESIIHSFIELLRNNYRREHCVDFYASRLNISAHYLTLIVKKITNQTPSYFIFEMLYSEARNLLMHSKLSIQEIAIKLNFSDQSSFGKFFKRRDGVSPAEYRKISSANYQI